MLTLPIFYAFNDNKLIEDSMNLDVTVYCFEKQSLYDFLRLKNEVFENDDKGEFTNELLAVIYNTLKETSYSSSSSFILFKNSIDKEFPSACNVGYGADIEHVVENLKNAYKYKLENWGELTSDNSFLEREKIKILKKYLHLKANGIEKDLWFMTPSLNFSHNFLEIVGDSINEFEPVFSGEGNLFDFEEFKIDLYNPAVEKAPNSVILDSPYISNYIGKLEKLEGNFNTSSFMSMQLAYFKDLLKKSESGEYVVLVKN